MGSLFSCCMEAPVVGADAMSQSFNHLGPVAGGAFALAQASMGPVGIVAGSGLSVIQSTDMRTRRE